MNDDVLYLEADEEITAAIDKLLGAKAASVRVVVPKRSTLLQSIVNLKLLKKAAADANKQLVLVTADRTATHLAGQVGLAVAASLNARPAVPTRPQPAQDSAGDIIEAAEETDQTAPGVTPPPAASAKTTKPGFARPMMARKAIEPAATAPATATAAGAKRTVPDFNALQKRLLWVGAAVGAIVVLLVANYFLKSAKVTLYAKGTKVDVNFGFSVDPKAGQSNYDKALLVGRELASAKELTATAAATGKKDVGTKAKGEMVVTNRTGAAQVLVAGTRFQAGDKLFRSDADVTVPGATVDGNGNVVPGKASVQVTAETAGDQFNLAPTRYTIPALAADKQDKIFGDGRQMAGGTSKQVAVVTQADIDKARVEALAKDKEAAQKDLDNKVPAGFRLIPESFSQTAGEVKASPGVDAEASQTSVTVAVNYSQLAVAEADFDQLLRAQEQKQIGADNQIYDSGASEAKISAGPREEGGRQRFTLVTAAYGGAKLDTGEIAEQIKGKKYGEAAEMTAKLPGIERSEISLSPVWSAKLPRLSKNIKIEVKVENAKG